MEQRRVKDRQATQAGRSPMLAIRGTLRTGDRMMLIRTDPNDASEAVGRDELAKRASTDIVHQGHCQGAVLDSVSGSVGRSRLRAGEMDHDEARTSSQVWNPSPNPCPARAGVARPPSFSGGSRSQSSKNDGHSDGIAAVLATQVRCWIALIPPEVG